jgi:hypothetical protein
MAASKGLNPTGVELVVCIVLGVLVGFSTSTSQPGGGIAGLLGRMVGSFLVFLLLLLFFKAIWRFGMYLVGRIRKA